MKKVKIIGIMILLLSAAGARATLFSETWTVNTAIPQGDPAGVSISETISGVAAGATVSALTVGLDISGGYNAGLVAYLVAPNGTLVMLMNQPGVSGSNPFGATGAGMNITLQDAYTSQGSIQNETSGSVLGGNYNAEGSLSDFNSSSVDGTWTLYFADLNSGGGTSTLDSFTIGVTPVSEPIMLALEGFAGILGGVAGFKWVRFLIAWFRRRKLAPTHIVLPN